MKRRREDARADSRLLRFLDQDPRALRLAVSLWKQDDARPGGFLPAAREARARLLGSLARRPGRLGRTG